MFKYLILHFINKVTWFNPPLAQKHFYLGRKKNQGKENSFRVKPNLIYYLVKWSSINLKLQIIFIFIIIF